MVLGKILLYLAHSQGSLETQRTQRNALTALYGKKTLYKEILSLRVIDWLVPGVRFAVGAAVYVVQAYDIVLSKV